MMRSTCLRVWLLTVAAVLCVVPPAATDSSRALADETDKAAFRGWFALLSELQFEHPAEEVTDCAALVRFAYRETLRSHSPEWARKVGLGMNPPYPDVKSGPQPGQHGWPLFMVRSGPPARYGEFADARTLVHLNTRPLGREVRAARRGDLLYFRQTGQRQPDHVMVFVGRSFFDPQGDDWVVYHTGPNGSRSGQLEADNAGLAQVGEDSGEVRKVRLADLLRHPAPRWRPVTVNSAFVGVFRFALL